MRQVHRRSCHSGRRGGGHCSRGRLAGAVAGRRPGRDRQQARAPRSAASGTSGSATSARAPSRESIPATNRVTGKVKVGAQPCGVAVGADSVWVDGYGTGNVERIDPEQMKVVARIPIGPSLWDVEFGADSVWATSETQRHAQPDRSGDERGHRDDQGRVGAASGPLRRRSDLGREQLRQEHLPRRSRDEPGDGGARPGCSRPTPSPSRTPRSGWRRARAR